MSRIEELEKQITELDERKVALQQELELEKQKTEIEYSFKNSEKYFAVGPDGCISDYLWDGSKFDKTRYSQGHIFKTKEEAAKERDRRILLTRFRQFRDKCNGDWKPKFSKDSEIVHVISFCEGKLEAECAPRIEQFYLFGYFKNRKDCQLAIRLFGDEIKRLFVEE